MNESPRVTEQQIDNLIVAELYHQFPGTTVTVCCLTLRNGFSAVGESACVSASSFNAEVGRDIARANAREKIWTLEGYLLCQMLHEARIRGVEGE